MAQFSLAEFLDFLDSQKEEKVLMCVAEMYELGKRGIFSTKFIPFADFQRSGYKGFKQYLQLLWELDSDFVEEHKGELLALQSNIKGDYEP